MTALIIFTDNPEHASLEPALAAAIPAANVPAVLEATSSRLRNLTALFAGEKYLYYSHYPNWNDKWDINDYRKRIQIGETLPDRIAYALNDALDEAPEAVIWLDNAAYGLREGDLAQAAAVLQHADVVIGETAAGTVLLIGFSPAAYGFGLPEAMSGDSIAAAATRAGLRALRLPLPAGPRSPEELRTLGITLE